MSARYEKIWTIVDVWQPREACGPKITQNANKTFVLTYCSLVTNSTLMLSYDAGYEGMISLLAICHLLTEFATLWH
jgi:hypothetical protein